MLQTFYASVLFVSGHFGEVSFNECCAEDAHVKQFLEGFYFFKVTG